MNLERLYGMLARAIACGDYAAELIIRSRIAAAERKTTKARAA